MMSPEERASWVVADLVRQREMLRDLLKRIYDWDMMDVAADGNYWRKEIEEALKRT